MVVLAARVGRREDDGDGGRRVHVELAGCFARLGLLEQLEVLIVHLDVVRVVGVHIGELLDADHALVGEYLLAHVRVRMHPLDARVELVEPEARALLDELRLVDKAHVAVGTTGQRDHVTQSGGGQYGVVEAQRVDVEHAQVEERHRAHVVVHVEGLLGCAELAALALRVGRREQVVAQASGRLRVLVDVERHDDMSIVGLLGAGAFRIRDEVVVVEGADLEVGHEPRVGGDGRYLPREALEHEELELLDGVLVVVRVVLEVGGEVLELGRIDLLDLGGEEERRDADELQAVDAHRRTAHHRHEAVHVLDGQVQRLAVQPVGVRDLDQPVDQDRAHRRLDALVATHVLRVVRVLGVLETHGGPQRLAVGPVERRHGTRGC